MVCYIILTFSTIGDRNNVIPASEIDHDIFQKEKNYDYLDEWYEGNDIQILHA